MPTSSRSTSSSSSSPASSMLTIGSKRFSPTGQAVPILSSPFPMECPLVHTTIPLPASGKLGVRFRWNGRRSDRVVITTIDDDSPLLSLHSPMMIQPQDTVVAVNHVAALKSSQVGHLIRLSHATVTLTTLPHNNHQCPPFTRVTAAPCRLQPLPPLAVESCRGRCLVRVSRVWGLDDAVAEGDVVLSLQGIPVTTPAAVDRILLWGNDDDRSTEQQPLQVPPPPPPSYVWMYTVDIKAYRTSVAWELQSAFPGVVWKEEVGGGKNNSSNSSIVAQISIGHDTKRSIPLEVDRETLHVKISSVLPHQKIRHAKLVSRYLQALNQGMEDRMRLLETLVCAEAYSYQRRRQEQQQTMMLQQKQSDDGVEVPSVASTSTASSSVTSNCTSAAGCRKRTTSDGTGSSTTCSSSSSGPEHEEAHPHDTSIVSVPAALVLPIAALQTCQERETTEETMMPLAAVAAAAGR